MDLVALCGLLLRVFKDLQVDPKKIELQLSVPRCFNDKTKAAIASLLFDEFEVCAVNMGHQTTFALHSYCTDTGIVVDVGERLEVVPIVGGYKVASGMSRTATGGGEMASHLRQALLGRNYSVASQLEGYVVRQVSQASRHQLAQVLENLCYVAPSCHVEVERCRADPEAAEATITVAGGWSMGWSVLQLNNLQVVGWATSDLAQRGLRWPKDSSNLRSGAATRPACMCL